VERTLVILKPDALQRRLLGRMIARFEAKGLKIVGLKMIRITPELAARHYGEHQGKPFYEPLMKFITSAPVVMLALEAPGVTAMVRRMVGKTFGAEADSGTMRGDFGVSNRYNLVHASDSPDSAARELSLFFAADELLAYKMHDEPWISELL
jgi:nucleoside-diphosphate kinase